MNEVGTVTAYYRVKAFGKGPRASIEVHEIRNGRYRPEDGRTRVVFDSCSECGELFDGNEIVRFLVGGESGIAHSTCADAVPGGEPTHRGSYADRFLRKVA